MAWIRFWHQGRCASGNNPIESVYEWYTTRPSDEVLKDEAEEIVPEWLRMSERGYKFGFEDVTTLPDDVKAQLIQQHEAKIHYSTRMLEILRS